MLITKLVKLQSPLLATKFIKESVHTGKPRREFVRLPLRAGEAGVKIKADLPRWNWAFLEARDALGLTQVATSAIIPQHYYVVKQTSTFVRKTRRGDQMIEEPFENLPSGQVLSWVFTLSQHMPPGGDGGGRFTQVPTEEEFDRMLAHIGENIGMSEWGHAFLYGRFALKS